MKPKFRVGMRAMLLEPGGLDMIGELTEKLSDGSWAFHIAGFCRGTVKEHQMRPLTRRERDSERKS